MHHWIFFKRAPSVLRPQLSRPLEVGLHASCASLVLRLCWVSPACRVGSSTRHCASALQWRCLRSVATRHQWRRKSYQRSATRRSCASRPRATKSLTTTSACRITVIGTWRSWHALPTLCTLAGGFGNVTKACGMQAPPPLHHPALRGRRSTGQESVDGVHCGHCRED